MMKQRKPLFLKSLAGASIALLLGLLLLQRGLKAKSDFYSVNGIITSLDPPDGINTVERQNPKLKFITIGGHDHVFEVFVGKDWGDFKPKFENIDTLSVGDSANIYYDENFKTRGDRINRLAYYIDSEEVPIFIKGNSDRFLYYFIIGLCIVMIVILIILKKLNKII